MENKDRYIVGVDPADTPGRNSQSFVLWFKDDWSVLETNTIIEVEPTKKDKNFISKLINKLREYERKEIH